MGKIVANLFATADGVVGEPHKWHFPYHSAEVGEVLNRGMQTQRSYLIGRNLYDQWVEFWPNSKDEPFASYINNLPKYVLTHRPIEGEVWANTTVIGADAANEVRAIKESTTDDIGMSGCPATVRWLVAEGLLDELNLLVDPIMVGEGERLFDTRVPLELASSTALPNGTLHLVYRPAPTT